VHAETAMNGGAIDAEKNPIRDGRPGRVLRIAIEAHLKKKLKKNKAHKLKNKTQEKHGKGRSETRSRKSESRNEIQST